MNVRKFILISLLPLLLISSMKTIGSDEDPSRQRSCCTMHRVGAGIAIFTMVCVVSAVIVHAYDKNKAADRSTSSDRKR